MISGGKIEKSNITNGNDFGVDYNTCYFDLTFNNLSGCNLSIDTYSDLVNGQDFGEVKSGVAAIYKGHKESYMNLVYYVNDYYEKSKKLTDYLYAVSTQDLIDGQYYIVDFYYEITPSGADYCYNIIEEYKFSLSSITFDLIYTEDIRNVGLITSKDEFFILYDKFENEDMFDSSFVTVYKKDENDEFKEVEIESYDSSGTDEPSTDNWRQRDNNDLTCITGCGVYKIKIETFNNAFIEERIIVVDPLNDMTINSFFASEILSNLNRVFDEDSNIPVYEKGITYDISSAKEFIVFEGVLKNLDTLEEIKLDNNNYKGTITEEGIYLIELKTNFEGENSIITIQFAISEKGDSNPYLNYERLVKFNKTNASNYKPSCYVASLETQKEGRLNVCFGSYEEAYNFYIEYNKSIIVSSNQSSLYLYLNTAYKSLEKIYEVIKQNSLMHVYKHYFELSDPKTYNTMINELYLNYIVNKGVESDTFMFYNEEVRNSLAVDEMMYISKLPYCIEGETGYNDFVFIKDEYGYISSEVKIWDIYNKEYKIEYFKSVVDQLKEQGCPNGMIKIFEFSKTGGREYSAKFINGFDMNFELSYKIKNENKNDEFSNNNHHYIETNGFVIKNIKNLYDDYYLVKINNTYYSSYESNEDICINEPGSYIVVISDRFGNSFQFDADVYPLEFDLIIDGKNYTTSYGKKVNVDNLKEGFTFTNYIDKEGNEYTELDNIYRDNIRECICSK